ncbi:DDHD-domain-containing protein [Acephala macrosclerotiorum]|nr:DDHD-domain-containing protein [Acephala macrosclerotiorum]
MESTPSESTNANKNEKPEKSYLTAAVESISPWGGSRSSTPKPQTASAPGEGSGLKNQHGGDHSTQRWHGLSSKRYPPDCPPLNARWFYAVDSPKRKPKLLKNHQEDTKPAPPPKKFVTFSDHDSRAIETAYQKLADEIDDLSKDFRRKDDGDIGSGTQSASSAGKRPNTSMNEAGLDENAGGKVRVPVHEDFLFDVDIEERELCPVYWLGPIYEVRRGSWFFQEGSTLRPCDENLATQLEEGYLKVKPFRYPKVPEKATSRPASMKPGEVPSSLAMSGAFSRSRAGSGELTPKTSAENLRAASQQSSEESSNPSPHQPQTYRLFGTYMNSIVTYQDASVAWLSADSIMSRVSSTVYQKFAGGGYLGGVKLVRGYSATTSKVKESSGDKTPSTPTTAGIKGADVPALQLDERQQKLLKRRSAPPSTSRPEVDALQESARQLTGEIDEEMEAEAVRKRDEKEIQNDYNDRDGEDQGREIEHLILVTHGIGQRLGMRTESVNFIHDVNVLRKTLKSVYGSSADLQALNSEIDKLPKNCRIQVLPVCWRHLLDFPKKSVRQSRREHDIGDAFGEEEEYPSLEDITVEGVPFVRSLITDLALDILLYQSAYREHISTIVLEEANRIFSLFCERNPDFKGKISLIGHSLGSAVLFDILCRQKEKPKIHGSAAHQKYYQSRQPPTSKHQPKSLDFDFEVEDFYCLGSPIGLFQMLKGRNILARHYREDALPAESPMDPDYMQDPFLAASASNFPSGDHISSITGLPLTISSPKTAQLYNIFHPSDPIAYRLEPLISPAMSTMKPQALPYTKKTISASVSGIGATIGQSVSGLWSSLSSGIASSILNRSLGLTSDDVARMESAPSLNRQASLSVGAGTNISGGVISPDTSIPPLQRENTNEKKNKLAENTAAADREGKGAPTLIDDEIETLYAGFQKRRKSHQQDVGDGDRDRDLEWVEAEERGKKLRREEAKVRALNGNGRVDYAIQESVLDFNPINTIASHLSYWADEDVSHFIMSQLLSRHRVTTRAHSKSDTNPNPNFNSNRLSRNNLK